MRRGNFDRLVEPMNAQGVERRHVRMQSMSLATSIHDRSRERNYSCNATLAGRSPAVPSAIGSLSAGPPRLTGRAFLHEPPVWGTAAGHLRLPPALNQPNRRPRKKPLFVVFCLMLAVSPSSAVVVMMLHVGRELPPLEG